MERAKPIDEHVQIKKLKKLWSADLRAAEIGEQVIKSLKNDVGLPVQGWESTSILPT